MNSEIPDVRIFEACEIMKALAAVQLNFARKFEFLYQNI